MNNLIPNEFKIDGKLELKWDRASLQEAVITIAMVVIIVVYVILIGKRYINKA